ncbi:MAG: hypothetical protein II547_02920 [Treponema sp.]|nr:hypothetical protein [Treponema sp.]
MSNGNFFQNLFAQFFGGNDAEAIKRRQLKNIAKDYSKTKNHFYRPNGNLAMPQMAKFFYEIYSTIGAAQAMLTTATPNILKTMVLNNAISDHAKELLEELTEENLKQKATTMPVKELTKHVKETLTAFLAEFDGAKIKATDDLYNNMLMFDSFCKFDFYFLLKKFDKGIKERKFDLQPHFEQTSGTYVAEDLKNFMAVAWVLPLDMNSWESVFALLKKRSTGGVDVVVPATWKKILAKLRSIRGGRVLEMIVQMITEDPLYKEVYRPEEHHIMDEYLQQIRRTVEDIMSRIKEAQTTGKIDNLVAQVFGDEPVGELKNYNEEWSEPFEKKGFEGFTYCSPLKYLRNFLSNYTKKDLRELSDIVLVRAEWADQHNAEPMSNSFHELLEISNRLTAFDEKISETGELGIKLKTYLPRADRDKDARGIIKNLLGDANDEAASFILEASRNFVTFDRNLKTVIEDFAKAPHSELILNWKDLDHFAEGKLKAMSISAYKKIFNFVGLMQNFQVSVNEKASTHL